MQLMWGWVFSPKKLDNAVANAADNNIMVLGGDCNCTLNYILDRNHVEFVIQHRELLDTWECSF